MRIPRANLAQHSQRVLDACPPANPRAMQPPAVDANDVVGVTANTDFGVTIDNARAMSSCAAPPRSPGPAGSYNVNDQNVHLPARRSDGIGCMGGLSRWCRLEIDSVEVIL